MLHVAVFGSSEPLPGEELYDETVELGRLLARSGHAVVTGGYGGVMEAACRGAFEDGGHTVGIACSIFSDRRPNDYLRETRMTADLHERTQLLIEVAEAFVVTRGKAGTLSEVSFLWALERAGCLGGRPVILLGGFWVPMVADLERHGMLERSQIEATRIVTTPAAAVAALGDDGETV